MLAAIAPSSVVPASFAELPQLTDEVEVSLMTRKNCSTAMRDLGHYRSLNEIRAARLGWVRKNLTLLRNLIGEKGE
jgi:hypothetical protein